MTEYQQAGTGQSYSEQQYAQSNVSHAWVNQLDQISTDYFNLKPIVDTAFKKALTVQT